jgi:hypothetical protein
MNFTVPAQDVYAHQAKRKAATKVSFSVESVDIINQGDVHFTWHD